MLSRDKLRNSSHAVSVWCNSGNCKIAYGLSSDVLHYYRADLQFYRHSGGESMEAIFKRCVNPRWSPPISDRTGYPGIWTDRSLIVRLNIVLLTVSFFIHAFDIWSTVVILANGGEELNPITLWFMACLGPLNGLFIWKGSFMLLHLVVAYVCIEFPVLAWALALLIIMMMQSFLANNVPFILQIYGGAV